MFEDSTFTHDLKSRECLMENADNYPIQNITTWYMSKTTLQGTYSQCHREIKWISFVGIKRTPTYVSM